MARRAVKISGERSIKTKLHRLAYELEDDARRVRHDFGRTQSSLADALLAISSQLGSLSRAIEED